MKLLVLNCGSSSIKYQIIDMADERALARGLLERVGQPNARLTHDVFGRSTVMIEQPVNDHAEGLELVLGAICHRDHGAVDQLDEIYAVGHRVVHGGNRYRESVQIDDEVIAALHEFAELAPLHNPANLAGIEACRVALPGVPQVAVFDSAFHQRLPPSAREYALPRELIQQHGLRRYGFHGIAFRWATERAEALLGQSLRELKLVTLMLGSGCTANALLFGESVEVSTGFTPLEGLMQSTRSGDVDVAMILWLMEREGLSPAQMSELLYRRSGWSGRSGLGPDLRETIAAARNGNREAQLALDTFVHRCRKYVGAYAATMGGLHALIFTGGIGEKSPLVRRRICADFEFLGLRLDEAANEPPGEDRLISAPGSRVRVAVVVMNEELVIARDTTRLLS